MLELEKIINESVKFWENNIYFERSNITLPIIIIIIKIILEE